MEKKNLKASSLLCFYVLIRTVLSWKSRSTRMRNLPEHLQCWMKSRKQRGWLEESYKRNCYCQWLLCLIPSLAHQARKGPEEKTATSLKQSCSEPAVDKSSPSDKGQRITMTQNMSGTSPRKSPAPVKTSSKLALMKKRDEGRDEPQQSKTTSLPTKMKISPKKELMTSSSNQNKKIKSEATSHTVNISPKKPEVKASILFSNWRQTHGNAS